MHPQNMDQLIAVETQVRYVLFYGHKPAFWAHDLRNCLSQWYPAQFMLAGQEYPTAEHYLMAEKARLFGDYETMHMILKARGPDQAKALGRGVQGFLQEIWDREKANIAFKGNLAKFTRHEQIRNYLLSTGDAVLAESSPVDYVWGTGVAAHHSFASVPSSWRGKNLLGFVLMDVRHHLREHPAEPPLLLY